MSEWASVIAAVTPILTGAVGVGVGLLVGTLKRDELKRRLDNSERFSATRMETIDSLTASRKEMRDQLVEMQTKLLDVHKTYRDKHICALGMLVTAFGLKPKDLQDYAATVDCTQARAWKPADAAKPLRERAPSPMHGELISNYYKRVGEWLERQTTPPSK